MDSWSEVRGDKTGKGSVLGAGRGGVFIVAILQPECFLPSPISSPLLSSSFLDRV